MTITYNNHNLTAEVGIRADILSLLIFNLNPGSHANAADTKRYKTDVARRGKQNERAGAMQLLQRCVRAADTAPAAIFNISLSFFSPSELLAYFLWRKLSRQLTAHVCG